MMSSQQYGQAAPPSNMMFPTAAYLQASQNAAEMQMRGQEALGKGIAGGIGAAASGYMKYKDTKSEVGAAEKSYQTLRSFLPPEMVSVIDAQIDSMNQDPDLSLRDKAAFWNQAKGLIGNSVGQAFQMQKQKAELDAAAARQAATLEEQRMEPFRKKSAELLYNPMTSGGAMGPQNFGIQPQQNIPTGVLGGLL